MISSIVAVDIGNTFLHVARYSLPNASPNSLPSDAQSVPQPIAWESETAPRILQIDQPSEFQATLLGDERALWCVASVHRDRERQLADWIHATRSRDEYHLLQLADFMMPIDVQFPERVGRDRLVAAVAANELRERGHGAVIVDAGTAITVDLVDAEGTFQGGAILPGLSLGARALATFTDALPLVKVPHEIPEPLGKATEAAIQSGLYWGAVGAIQTLVDQYRRQSCAPLDVFITGGGAYQPNFLAPLEGNRVPHLVLLGVALMGMRICRSH